MLEALFARMIGGREREGQTQTAFVLNGFAASFVRLMGYRALIAPVSLNIHALGAAAQPVRR